MKPTTFVLIGVALASVAVPLTAGVFVWQLSSDRQEEAWLMSARVRSGRLELAEQGPPVQPAGTSLMSVRITPDVGMANLNMTGYKVMVLVHKKSDKQKEVVVPIVVDALVMSMVPSTSASNELMVSLAVPEDQTELLMYAMDSGANLQIKSPPCGGWLPRESDSQVFLAAAKSTDELLAILYND